MHARLYGMAVSHPANAARLMLEHKSIPYDLVDVMPGTQAIRIRAAGFSGGTVPALKLDGRRVHGTLAISRALDEVRPEPPLFPADPEQRRAVEEAEAWCERVLQPVPRRLLRWALARDAETRAMFVGMLGFPVPTVSAVLLQPNIVLYARREDARSTERIRTDWVQTPAHLDRVDALIAEGVIGGEQRNAADFQIGTTIRVMLAFADYAPLLAGRPAEQLALALWPDYPTEVPALVPDDMRAAADAQPAARV